MRPVFEAMLTYRARGWVPVLLHAAIDGRCTCGDVGCTKPAKHSRGTWGSGEMPDELRVRAWAQRTPSSNVGVNTGASGLYVVDLDGPDAVATWQAWLDEHGRAPTLTSRTRRGFHLWFRQPEGDPLGSSAGTLATGIDTRGAGGMVVAPPSTHASGHVYSWCQGPTEPAPCPQWLADKARAGRAPVVESGRQPVTLPADSPRQHAYLSRAVQGEVQRVLDAVEGTRNHTLNRAAYSLGQLVGAGALDVDAVTHALLTAAGAVGLDELEAVPTIRSGLRAGAQNPRSLAS